MGQKNHSSDGNVSLWGKKLYPVPRLPELEESLFGLFKAISPGKPNFYGVTFKNETFETHPYCWCEKEDCPQCSKGAPNFHHKPSGLMMSWYQSPLHDALSNKPLEPKEFLKIISECVSSINGSGSL